MAVLRNLKAVSNSVGWGNNNAKTHYICLWYLEKKKKKKEQVCIKNCNISGQNKCYEAQ